MRRYVPAAKDSLVKIISAKLNKEPFHSLSRKEIKLILSILPPQWIEGINEIVLSAEIYSKPQTWGPVVYAPTINRLKILSRGFNKADIVKEVILELAIKGAAQGNTKFANNVPEPAKSNRNILVSFFATEYFNLLEHNK